MKDIDYTIRNAKPNEYKAIGELMVEVYSRLEGFPKRDEQPDYYNMLENIGEITKNPGTELLIAVEADEQILGAVVYFSDMKYYGSGGTATQEKNASGFRLLAVVHSARGKGVGKLLTLECINRSKEHGNERVLIHSTKFMQTAWKMYENMGFVRYPEIDFYQGELPVYGFKYLF
ncbi:GNAT family N-acetyltransferase [Christiangramia salexigens]|uniref:GNAT family N-acetyltransferase n=1 Tax=Christiangramia salexigens TaxID=1913577 RepID=A0A1L3J482_9FLAO|nr:GNAT family N-acetyltransferase [Christiangramia salexigens]APG59913.1 GNAT family N-acetyltransferase [Christiangramia salexigens]